MTGVAMRKFLHPLVVAGSACALLASCVTTRLTPDASRVRVTGNSAVVSGCEYLGDVKASDRMNGGLVGQDAAEENTDRRMRNAAAAMGGNVVHLQRERADYFGASARGEVYRCPP